MLKRKKHDYPRGTFALLLNGWLKPIFCSPDAVVRRKSRRHNNETRNKTINNKNINCVERGSLCNESICSNVGFLLFWRRGVFKTIGSSKCRRKTGQTAERRRFCEDSKLGNTHKNRSRQMNKCVKIYFSACTVCNFGARSFFSIPKQFHVVSWSRGEGLPDELPSCGASIDPWTVLFWY
mmetsp:Transcript_3282/g.8292  ORF Transcript_3282/g.8292 Transcript_3282/m.8292 type:complete len:180 (-) Transcript_3282:916-1455(-)